MKSQKATIEEVRHSSSLFLQIFLWLNVYVFVVWALAYVFFILHNAHHAEKSQVIFTSFGYTAAVVTEFLRLFLGYSGNLKRKPVDLSVFLVVSTVIQTPILLYLTLFLDTELHIIILGCFILFCVLFEVNLGAHTWRRMSMQQNNLQRIKLLLAENRTAELSDNN